MIEVKEQPLNEDFIMIGVMMVEFLERFKIRIWDFR